MLSVLFLLPVLHSTAGLFYYQSFSEIYAGPITVNFQSVIMSLLGRGLLVARRQVAATMVTATKQSQVVAEECWGIAGPLITSLVISCFYDLISGPHYVISGPHYVISGPHYIKFQVQVQLQAQRTFTDSVGWKRWVYK